MDVLRICQVVFLVCVCRVCNAQPSPSFENLSIDRPDVSNLPTTVRPGHYQFEIGLEFDKNRDSEEFYLPGFILRTGLGKKTELRLGTTLGRVDSVREQLFDYVASGSLSVKHRLWEERGWRPSLAVQPEINLSRTRGEGTSSDEITYDVLLLFNNTFHEQVFLNYNTGFYWIGSRQKRLLLSASLSFMHTHRVGYFVEVFTLRTWQESRNFSFDGGITYLVRPRFQVDVYAGKRWALGSSFRFIGAGVGFRLDKGDVKPKSFKDIGIHH